MPRLKNGVGYVERDTSHDAAIRLAPETLRERVWIEFVKSGWKGKTCEQIEDACALSHQTASARIRELFLAGRIVDSGDRRQTRSGRSAIVWVFK